MKVILGAAPIQFPLTGIGRYTFELAKGIQTSDRVDDLLLFKRRSLFKEIPSEQIGSSEGSKAVASPFKKAIQKIGLVSEIYRIVHPRIQQHFLRPYSDYIYHGPNFYLPRFDGLKIATFHDLSPFTWSHCHPIERVKFMQKELKRTIDTADALITDSEYTKHELCDYFGLDVAKVHAVPLAASPGFRPRHITECEAVLNHYSLGFKKFSLYVGTIEPRKNIEGLLDAYSRLPLKLRLEVPLILSGYQGWENAHIHQKIERGTKEGWVRYLGFLPADHLPILFSAAATFIFPSHYEGFGLPVLEAMASGTPVVCSNSSSLPEVAGNAALMSDPEDIDKLYENISKACQDNQWSESASDMGVIQAKKFSWEQCAERTVDVYESVLFGKS